MQWEDIRYFLALAQHGSLSAAARALHVEHSTVSRRVSALEETLHIRLFDRLPRGWQLTAEGQALLAQAQRMETEALAFTRAATQTTAIAGTVRLSFPPSLGNLFLIPQLAAQRTRWQAIDLNLLSEARNADLLRHEADIAVRLGRPQSSELATKRLATIGFGLYTTPPYLERLPEDWCFVGYDKTFAHVAEQQWLEHFSDGRRFILRCNEFLGVLNATVAGLGVAVLPHYLARTHPTLVAVPGTFDIPHREAWLVVHPDVRRAPRVRLIADVVIDIFQHHARWLAEGLEDPDLFSSTQGVDEV